MKKSFFISLGVAVLAGLVLSCTKANDDPTPVPDPVDPYFEKEGLTPSFDSAHFSDAVAYLGGMKSSDEAWIRARAGGNLVSDPSSATIIILDNSLVSSNEEMLAESYDAGKIIIIGSPDLENLRALRKKHEWRFVIPEEAPGFDFALAFCQQNSFLLVAPVYVQAEVQELDGTEEEIDIIGEDVYDGASMFESGLSLMTFIDDAQDNLASYGTKTSVSAPRLSEIINVLNYTYPRSEYWDTNIRGRNFRIYNSFTISYSIYPCYVSKGFGDNAGDYYVVKAVANNFPPTAYEFGKKPEERRSATIYWPGKYTSWGNLQIRGPYNTGMSFKSHTVDPSNFVFTAKGVPVPANEIDVRDYSQTVTDSWSMGLSGGWNESQVFNIGFNAGIGGSKSYSVRYSTKDLKVENRFTNSIVDYNFVYRNLPERDSDFDEYESRMTTISKNTASFDMSWEWKTASPRNDYDDIVFPLATEVEQRIAVWARDTDYGRWHNHMYNFKRSSDNVDNKILKLARIPVGCLRIENKCSDNQILYDIVVATTQGKTVYKSKNSIAQGEHLEVILPQKDRTYSVFFNMGKSKTSTIPYYSIDSAIELELVADEKTGKRVLYATENGGDFVTNSGMIRVKNQSLSKLVMNLTVYDVNNTPVLEYPNHLGFFESADLYVTAGKEYYVTMEFGSESSSKPYKTASNFTVKPYTSEKDIKVLIATDDGGSFVLQ